MLYMDRRYSDKEFDRMNSIMQFRLILHNKFYKYFPRGYWLRNNSKENFLTMVRYLFEEELHWSDVSIIKKLRPQLFKQYRLDAPLRLFYDNNLYNMIMDAYPNKFEKWMLMNNKYLRASIL